MFIRKLRLAVFIIAAARMAVAADAFFQDGRTDWKIHLAAQADPTEAYAAQELRDALKKISGADFDVVSNAAPDSRAIVIGDLKNPDVQVQAAALKLTAGKVEEVAVYTLGGRLYLAGNQPRGALYAVYSFLQRDLGVRWLWPGADGEFIPAKTRWSLPQLEFNFKPAFPYRGFHLCGDDYRAPDSEIFRQWMGRNFINIYRHAAPLREKRRGFHSMWSSHNVSLPRPLFDQHPEYFAEFSGKRYAENICFNNPEVDRLVADQLAEYVRQHPYIDILSVFPRDTSIYCRCEKCAKMDPSAAWFEFYNRLTDVLKKEFPDLKFATIAYFEYRAAPKCRIRNSEFVEYASYSRCNIHPYGHPDCKQNEETMRDMLAWQATGLPIGNYAYEFDIFKTNPRFTPFLTMIDDAIKTGKRLGHVAMIPEVLLISPKYVPAEEYVFNVQQRLPIYLYARLLWEPDRKMTDILRDWCRTAFGPAADPMYDYYIRMDRAWGAMPTHTTILGNALGVAPLLLAGKLPEEAAAAFAAAEQRLPEIKESAARDRAAAAITRERTFFKQWQDLCHQCQTDVPRLDLPLQSATNNAESRPQSFGGTNAETAPSATRVSLAWTKQWQDLCHQCQTDVPRSDLPLQSAANSAEQFYSRPQSFGGTNAETAPSATRVSLAWTKEAMVVRWGCHDPQMKNLKTAASTRDGKVVEDDSVELVLSSGLTGETWHFAANPSGIMQDYRYSAVGVREDLWNPEWRVTTRRETNGWEADMTIPFASLGQRPNPNESWQARFLRHNGGRQDIAPGVFPTQNTALLFFSSVVRTDRALLWWSGAPERESGKDAGLREAFSQLGWQLNIVTNAQKLLALHGQCDAYWFRHPAGPNPVPADYWRKDLASAVSNGALAVFASYWGIPVDQYFNDPSLKVRSVFMGDRPLSARRSVYIARGDWSLKPNDFRWRLEKKITPAYGFVPVDSAAWTVLATAPLNDKVAVPYLLAKRYGKGMIMLCGDNIPLSTADMLENFVLYCESLNQTTASEFQR